MPNRKTMKDEQLGEVEWELVGYVGVDTATIYIGDPISSLSREDGVRGAVTVEEYMHGTLEAKGRLPDEPDGARQFYDFFTEQHSGVAIDTGTDGRFPVYISRYEDGPAAMVLISIDEVWQRMGEALGLNSERRPHVNEQG